MGRHDPGTEAPTLAPGRFLNELSCFVRLARRNWRVVKLAMEERWTASAAARVPGLSLARRPREARRPAQPTPAQCRRHSSVLCRSRRWGSSRRRADGPFVAAWRRDGGVSSDASDGTRDSVRYLAGVGVSAIPPPQPHVRLGRPLGPLGGFHVLGFVAGSYILGALAGLSLAYRGRMSLSGPVYKCGLGSSCGSDSARPSRLSGLVFSAPTRCCSATIRSATAHARYDAARSRSILRRS